MSNDRIFTAYALLLVSGIVSTLAASVLAGFASLPSAPVFFEHVALGLAIRTSYKLFGGFDWADWSFTSDATAAEVGAEGNLVSASRC